MQGCAAFELARCVLSFGLSEKRVAYGNRAARPTYAHRSSLREMATRAAATAAKAIYAEPAFIPKGPINSGRFNLIREIAIGFTLGLTGGMMWKMWHWGEKRRLAQYYSELYAKEKADEDAFTDELRAKIKALEEELLG